MSLYTWTSLSSLLTPLQCWDLSPDLILSSQDRRMGESTDFSVVITVCWDHLLLRGNKMFLEHRKFCITMWKNSHAVRICFELGKLLSYLCTRKYKERTPNTVSGNQSAPQLYMKALRCFVLNLQALFYPHKGDLSPVKQLAIKSQFHHCPHDLYHSFAFSTKGKLSPLWREAYIILQSSVERA